MMASRPFPPLLRRLAASAVLLVCAGCAGGDPPTAPDMGGRADTLLVAVRHRDTGTAARGVKLALLDARNRLAAAPALVDSLGTVRFAPGTEAGPLYLAAFTGDSLFVHELPPPLLPAAGLPDEAVVLVGTRSQPGGLPRLSGTVVDAETGEPLGGAFLGLSPYLGAYLGRVEPSDDVSLADGAFRVGQIPFAADPISGNPRQILPLLVARAGYLPRAYVHQMTPGDDNLDIAGVVVALRRETGGDGRLAGVVRFGGDAVSGLPIGLGAVGAPDDPTAVKSAVGQPGRVAVTDAEGGFAFAGLPAGGYVVHAGYLPDDGWIMPGQPAGRLYAVAAGETVLTDTLHAIRAIAPLAPLGALPAAPDRFAWAAVAEADSYAVRLDGRPLAVTAAPEAAGLELDDLAPGWHAWTVTAFTADGRVVGNSETFARFRIPPPAPAR
jgi:hypothetical protein